MDLAVIAFNNTVGATLRLFIPNYAELLRLFKVAEKPGDHCSLSKTCAEAFPLEFTQLVVAFIR